MKKKNIILLLAFFVWHMAYTQSVGNKNALGINFVKNEYNGDYGNGLYDFSQPVYSAFSLSYSKYLSKSFDLNLLFTTGNYGYRESSAVQFVGSKSDFSLSAHYKLNNGYFFAEESKLSPFISVGLGFASYAYSNDAQPYPTIILDKSDFIIPFGFGLKYQLNKNIAIQYQYKFNITNSDVHDQNISGGITNTYFGSDAHPNFKAGNDMYGQQIIGFVFSFGKERDSDKDGVLDKFDLSPKTPLNVMVDEDGIPVDSDHDGVPNYLDKCENTPSRTKVDAFGCPIEK